MNLSRSNSTRTFHGALTPNSSGGSDDADIIFIKKWARRYSAKEGARQTGMTPKGFQKIQLGENAISYGKLTHWLKTNPDLAAAYAEHVGLLRPGEAECAAAFTHFVNAAVRLKP